MSEMEMVAKEVAEQDFARYIEYWDIFNEFDDEDKEDKASFKEQRSKVIREIRRGHATVDDKGEVDFTLHHPSGDLTSLHFQVPTGLAFYGMDKHKEQKFTHKVGSILNAMTGQPEATFKNMDGRDFKFCQGMALLFLGG